MPIEDGIRKATKKLDEAADAAPTSEVADTDDFGLKDKATEANGTIKDNASGEEPTPDTEDQHDDSED